MPQGGVLTSVMLGLQQQHLLDIPTVRLCIIFGSGPSRHKPHQVGAAAAADMHCALLSRLVQVAHVGVTGYQGGVILQVAYQQKIRCPALLSWGTRDRLAPWSEMLVERFESPVTVVHDKGHVVPPLNSEQLAVVRTFLQQQQQQRAPQIISTL